MRRGPARSRFSRRLGDIRLGHHEGVAVTVVETDCDVARELKVLFLVYAHGHEVGAEQQNVRRHEHGIVHEPHVDVVGVPGALVLELGHTGRLADIGVAVENPLQLGVFLDMRLEVKHGFFGVDAAREELCEKAHARLAKLRGLPPHGEGVQVGDEENRVELLLHFAPVLDRAEIISQRNRARGLNPAQHHFFGHIPRFIVHFRHINTFFLPICF